MVRVKTPISKQQRQEQILNEVRVNAAVRIADLAERFGTSTETIRRDLDLLGRQGLLNRTYGGGTPPVAFEANMRDRHRLMAKQRWRIAEAAAALVEPGEAIMIDAGSTTLHLALALASLNRPIVAVTNGLAIADALGKSPQIRVIVCPGELNAPQSGMVGPETHQFLSRLNANRAFIGASGLTPEGPTEAESSMAWVKRAMIERARVATLLIDHSKFNINMLEIVCPIEALHEVFTDEQPDAALSEAIQQAGTTLTVVP